MRITAHHTHYITHTHHTHTSHTHYSTEVFGELLYTQGVGQVFRERRYDEGGVLASFFNPGEGGLFGGTPYLLEIFLETISTKKRWMQDERLGGGGSDPLPSWGRGEVGDRSYPLPPLGAPFVPIEPLQGDTTPKKQPRSRFSGQRAAPDHSGRKTWLRLYGYH